MYCVKCQSSERKWHVTSVLLKTFFSKYTSISEIPTGSKCRILSTCLNDPWRSRTKSPNFHFSGYESTVPFGSSLGDRATSQNVEALTFDDSSFDVVVTEDVLEHVRDYAGAFLEIKRVLAPGGKHIFTVPFMFDHGTLVRVDATGPDDIHLVDPEYHGPHLAYRTFGRNLLHELQAIGFTTTVDRQTDSYVFISLSTKSE
jgi:SAM-dependent methyltransferase